MRIPVLSSVFLVAIMSFAAPASAQAPKAGDAAPNERDGRGRRGGGREKADEGTRQGGDGRDGRGGDKKDGDKKDGGDGRDGRGGDKKDGDKKDGGDGRDDRGDGGARPGGDARGGWGAPWRARGARPGRDWRDDDRDDDDDDDDDDARDWRRDRRDWRRDDRRDARDWRRDARDRRGRGYDGPRGRRNERRGPPRDRHHPWARADHHAPHGFGHDGPRSPYAWGGLGYLAIGLMHGSFHFLDEALRDPTALGAGWRQGDTAVTFGGGGGALIGRRLWLGGKGFGFVLPTESSGVGRARISGGGGGFELGLAAINHAHAIVIPYIGLGGMVANVNVRNRSASAMSLGGAPVLPAGQDRSLTSTFWTLDAGIRAFGVYFPGGGGWAAGIDLGLTTSLVPNSFELDGNPLSGVAPARMTAGYLRLVLGGGGFFQPRPHASR